MTEPTGLRPTDLPRLRDTMVAWSKSRASRRFWSQQAAQMSEDMGVAFAGEQLQRLSISAGDPDYRTADLFWVAPDMAELAAHAATSLPDFVIEAPDVPTPRGFLLAPSAFCPPGITDPVERASYATHGFAWSVDDDGVRISYLAAKEPYLDACRSWMPRADRRDMARDLPPVFERQVAGWAQFGVRDDAPAGDAGHPMLTLKSVWLLMQQTLADVAEADGMPAPSGLRPGRPPAPPPVVRVIRLRRPAGPGSGSGESSRTYRHQWIVRGYWKQQPYGPRGSLRRPQWIPPHLNGPEDAPLLGGDKVHVWDR